MNWLQNNKLIALLILVKFFLPFLLPHPDWELHRDEYLYYQQGQHLSLGYLENPPMIGLLAWISSLLGGNEWMITFWPATTGAATLFITVRMAQEFGGGWFAKLVVALGLIFSAFMRIHLLFQPNMLDIFFWVLSVYYLLRYINTRSNRFLYYLAVAVALGLWSKYSILFLVASLGIAIVLSPYRLLLKNKHLWFAIVTGIVIILPNIAWQFTHNWPFLHHMAELRDTQLKYISMPVFLKEQVLLLFPVLFVWLGGLYWLLFQKKYRVFAYLFLSFLLLLMMGSGKGYYALGAYPMLLAAGGRWLEILSGKRMWIRFASVVVILALSLPFVPLLLPVQSPGAMKDFNKKYAVAELGLLKWEDQEDHALQQDFADMTGWKELAQRSEAFYYSLPDSVRKSTIVYCRNYGQAGALKYFAKENEFRNKVISDNGTFLLWIKPGLPIGHLLFVGEEIPAVDDEVFNHFQDVTPADSVRNPLSRSFGTKIILYRNADDSASIIANKGLAEMKNRFSRKKHQ